MGWPLGGSSNDCEDVKSLAVAWKWLGRCASTSDDRPRVGRSLLSVAHVEGCDKFGT
jgi:hypothetical protein